ncbi:MAG TPA: dephospho-CoA kinase [Longimicrobiales bacterium]|nr:dephospho-CoA kinase [Longimicrobiales bacterium]
MDTEERKRRGGGGLPAAARLARVVLRHPALAWPLLRAGWRFRRRDWFRRPPFLPLPPPNYLEWRLETAYGSTRALPEPTELRRYLRWTDWMQADERVGEGARASSAASGPGTSAAEKRSTPYSVGLTGNAASGKTTVANSWRALGAYVVDADELARRAVAPGSPALGKIRETFGDDVIAGDGSLDRVAMRRRILEDPGARARLESIVHPEVARLRREEELRAERAGAKVVVHDIPLLFEVGLEDEFDVIVFVDSPRDARVERLMARGLERWEAEALSDAQWPPEVKRAASDLVVDNTGSIAELESRAAETWREILRRART